MDMVYCRVWSGGIVRCAGHACQLWLASKAAYSAPCPDTNTVFNPNPSPNRSPSRCPSSPGEWSV